MCKARVRREASSVQSTTVQETEVKRFCGSCWLCEDTGSTISFYTSETLGVHSHTSEKNCTPRAILSSSDLAPPRLQPQPQPVLTGHGPKENPECGGQCLSIFNFIEVNIWGGIPNSTQVQSSANQASPLVPGCAMGHTVTGM